MAIRAPLKFVAGTGTADFAPMSQSDFAYVRYLLRTEFSQNEMRGWVRINSAPAGWASIGAYSDTLRSTGGVSINVTGNQSPPDGNPDAEPGYNINNLLIPITTNTFTFYQNFNNPSEIPSSAIQNSSAMVLSSNAVNALTTSKWTKADVDDTIIDPCFDEIKAGGNGRFYIGTSVPAGYTATGTSNVTDTIQNSTAIGGNSVGTVTTYTLSIRTGETFSGTVVRPLINVGGASGTTPEFREMTDQEILDAFMPYFRNRIAESNKLVYQMQTTNNNINCGILTDTRHEGSTTTTPATKIYTRVISGGTSTITTYYFKLLNA